LRIVSPAEITRPVRICITRAIDRAGWHGCVVLESRPPVDPTALIEAAARLDVYDWLVCASPRAVIALHQRRGPAAWPLHLRTAAVGTATARALHEAGVVTPPVTGPGDGAASLWTRLAHAAHWPGQRALVLTTPGGRTDLADHLTTAGARVEMVDAYAMRARAAADIRHDWAIANPGAVVITSPRSAVVLIDAIGAAALASPWVVAIGDTTSERLRGLAIPHDVAPIADLDRLAPWLESRLRAEEAT
jgi:uroporphyrinogen-III synthase